MLPPKYKIDTATRLILTYKAAGPEQNYKKVFLKSKIMRKEVV